MEIRPLSIAGAWEITSPVHGDDRGLFREWFKQDAARDALGIDFTLAQANLSVSRRDVVRGIHYSIAPEGQAKWVTCAHGTLLDVIVDIRTGSPTFSQWEAVELSADAGTSVLIASGLGHGFVARSDQATIAYLLTSPYAPGMEFGVHPLDPALGIDWGTATPLLSPKDAEAPLLAEAVESELPRWHG